MSSKSTLCCFISSKDVSHNKSYSRTLVDINFSATQNIAVGIQLPGNLNVSSYEIFQQKFLVGSIEYNEEARCCTMLNVRQFHRLH